MKSQINVARVKIKIVIKLENEKVVTKTKVEPEESRLPPSSVSPSSMQIHSTTLISTEIWDWHY